MVERQKLKNECEQTRETTHSRNKKHFHGMLYRRQASRVVVLRAMYVCRDKK